MKSIGQIAVPKQFPELKSKVKAIREDWNADEDLYVLENGTFWTENELK